MVETEHVLLVSRGAGQVQVCLPPFKRRDPGLVDFDEEETETGDDVDVQEQEKNQLNHPTNTLTGSFTWKCVMIALILKILTTRISMSAEDLLKGTEPALTRKTSLPQGTVVTKSMKNLKLRK